MITNSNLARDKGTEAELLSLLFPEGIGNLSVEAFRTYSEDFLVFYKALLSDSADGENLEFTDAVQPVDLETLQCVQDALDRRG